MAATVTYAWYTQEYGGDLSEAAFSSALPAALRHVVWLCDGREPAEGELAAWRRAVCAADEAFAEYGEGQVGGFQVGDFKVTHYEDEGTTGSEQATVAALQELLGTAMAFTGVR